MNRRILLASYFYPPDVSVGSHRWPALVRHLRPLGYDTTVLTTSAFGSLPDDGYRVVRTQDLIATSSLRRLLGRPPLKPSGVPTAVTAPAPKLLRDGLVPDSWLVSWLPFAVRAARSLLRRDQYDCIVTNSPSDSTHLLGFLLGPGRPAWIADFEDGWRYEPLRGPWPTRTQDRLDSLLEAHVARSVDRITCVTGPIAKDFRRRFGVEADWIPIAWDPDLEGEVRQTQPPQLDAGYLNIVHTGALTHPERRDPSGLFAGLRLLTKHHPAEAARIRLVLAGPLTDDERRIVQDTGLGELIVHVGPLPRMQAIALQRRADALLLLTSGDHVSQVTGKVFEYLAADRPILCLASNNEAERLIRDTHTGLTVAPDDIEGILDALLAALDGRLRDAHRPVNLERYRHPAPAEAFAESIERAIVARSARLLA